MERIPEDLPASSPVELDNSFLPDLITSERKKKHEKSLSILGPSWVWEDF